MLFLFETHLLYTFSLFLFFSSYHIIYPINLCYFLYVFIWIEEQRKRVRKSLFGLIREEVIRNKF